MASSMALRRATTTSTLLTKFLNSPSRITSPLATRSFATSSRAAKKNSPTATAKEDNSDYSPTGVKIVVQGAPEKYEMENPFQSMGPANVLMVDEEKDSTLVRVALPGVGEDGYKVWAEKNTVFFMCKGDIEHEGEESGRKYGGSLQFDPRVHHADGVKAEMKNGILRMMVPYAGGIGDH
ncbi:hypothetical protein RJ640_020473 [Escallonia rubra]|uniref:SHSP domain-containing protein n=1 Tax=Escallonia rubra TaxID=112253 RepID=A0AA88UG51_9ASTE|nr:hypothetical protein RJ640_020473 [Escallonia rubra]